MSLISLAEKGLIPDCLVRFGIRRLLKQRLKDEFINDPEMQSERYCDLIGSLRQSSIALETNAANEQHYEVPTEFFLHSLGKHLKYSSCYWRDGVTDLAQAEEDMLRLTCDRAEIFDGAKVLELGCGWGSLTLWIAEHFPNSEIVAVSNSATQREYITRQAETRGLSNVTVLTVDMNQFQTANRFDRVVSVEMFEHMRNYEKLMSNIAEWLNPGGKLFVHIFCHRVLMYPFEIKDERDWMAQYFFSGGLMPASDTLLHFQNRLRIEQRWLFNGTHYAKTLEAWLKKTDINRKRILEIFSDTYGAANAAAWLQRWRMFYMACAELFAYNRGDEWLVAHYRFVKA